MAAASHDSPVPPEYPRPPLVDEFHERAVLGTLLAQPDADHAIRLYQELAPLLDDSDFTRQENRRVWYAIRSATTDNRRGVLIGDLFRRPNTPDAAYLAGLVADSTDATIVRQSALYVAREGLSRLILGGAFKVGTSAPSPAAVEAFNANVQAKRARIARFEGGGEPAPRGYNPLKDDDAGGR
jgi:hypothetical protein